MKGCRFRQSTHADPLNLGGGDERNVIARESITSANTPGERGHPCLVPLETGKASDTPPLRQRAAEAGEKEPHTSGDQ